MGLRFLTFSEHTHTYWYVYFRLLDMHIANSHMAQSQKVSHHTCTTIISNLIY